jgi:hypothetical protein
MLHKQVLKLPTSLVHVLLLKYWFLQRSGSLIPVTVFMMITYKLNMGLRHQLTQLH